MSLLGSQGCASLASLTGGSPCPHLTVPPRFLSVPQAYHALSCLPSPLLWAARPLHSYPHLCLKDLPWSPMCFSSFSHVASCFPFATITQFLSIYLCVYLLFFLFWLHRQHTEVAGLGIKSRSQLQPTRQCQIPNPLHQTRDQIHTIAETRPDP